MCLFRLQLHPTKTRLVELGLGKEGFTFLGCYLRIVRPRGAIASPLAKARRPRSPSACGCLTFGLPALGVTSLTGGKCRWKTIAIAG